MGVLLFGEFEPDLVHHGAEGKFQPVGQAEQGRAVGQANSFLMGALPPGKIFAQFVSFTEHFLAFEVGNPLFESHLFLLKPSKSVY